MRTSEVTNTDLESKTTTQMTEDNGGHSTTEPDLLDLSGEETMPSLTNMDKDTILEESLFPESGEMRFTKR